MIDSTPTRAWWVYDPASGMFWDQLPDGRSGSAVLFGPMADYAIELWTFTKTLKGFLLLGACVFQIVSSVGALLNGIDSPTAGNAISYVGNLGGAGVACGAYLAAGAV
jgi:hypothetical protein